MAIGTAEIISMPLMTSVSSRQITAYQPNPDYQTFNEQEA